MGWKQLARRVILHVSGRMKFILLTTALLLTLGAVQVRADRVNVPKEDPVVTINIPKSWEPEHDDEGVGVQAESPDNFATIYAEVVASKEELKDAIDASVEWLMKDCEVAVDEKSQSDSDFEVEGRQWSRISWKGKHPESGAAVVGFLFTDAGDGHVLTITYWLEEKQSEKGLEALGKILASVKPVE